MEVLKKIKTVLIVVIGFVYFSFALFMTILLLNYNDYGVTQFGETSIILIKNKVSLDGYEKGDLVLVEALPVEEIKKGDTLFTYKVVNNIPEIQVGKVGEVYTSQNSISFENGNTFSQEFIAGKPTKVYHDLGGFLALIESQWGFLFLVLVPCFLIFIYEVYALIVEIKYGQEEKE